MNKGFLQRLEEMNHASYVDLSRDVPLPKVGARRERDCIEDRTNAHVMRENGRSPFEIEKRFGYIPTPLEGSKAKAPFPSLPVHHPASASEGKKRTEVSVTRRNFLEPG